MVRIGRFIIRLFKRIDRIEPRVTCQPILRRHPANTESAFSQLASKHRNELWIEFRIISRDCDHRTLIAAIGIKRCYLVLVHSLSFNNSDLSVQPITVE